VTLLSIIGVLFGASRLHRAGITLMLFGGPGLVMLSRAAEPIKEATGLSSAAILAVWALILLAGDPALASDAAITASNSANSARRATAIPSSHLCFASRSSCTFRIRRQGASKRP
jgi:hypothetical protein